LPTGLGPADAGKGWITTDTGHLWVWDGDSYSDAGNITGPPGAIGPQGPQGVKGDTGATGATGAQGTTGATGSQGPAGVAGPTGPAGADGALGPQGIQGAKGDKGDAGGQGVQGPIGTTGAKGDKGDPGATGAQGPQGNTGAAGVDGAQGPQGIKGDTGATGATGSQGPTGTQGPQGVKGDIGTPGTPGTAGTPGEKWFSGTGAPSGAIGIVGDWYLNDANGDVYEKTGASAWTARDNLTGPQGIQGTAGTAGAAGAKWLTGTSAPAAGTGAVGDWYINTTTSDIYEKTGSSTWTARGNLKGAQGTTGTAGTAGEKWFSAAGAPAAGTGAVGDWYLNTTTYDIYEKTGSSTWTARGNIKGAPGTPGADGGGVIVHAGWRYIGASGGPANAGQVEYNRYASNVTVHEIDGSGTSRKAELALVKVGDYLKLDSSDDTAEGFGLITSIDPYSSQRFYFYLASGSLPAPAAPTSTPDIPIDLAVSRTVAGPAGPAGPAGTPGSKWFTGNLAPPTVGNPAGAVVGDNYLNTDTGALYQLIGQGWSPNGNIKGPAGVTTVWRSGLGAPAGALGVVGDWYLDTANGNAYEKTGGLVWALRTNLTGPQGVQGVQGPQGNTGSTGATGSQGVPGGAIVTGDWTVRADASASGTLAWPAAGSPVQINAVDKNVIDHTSQLGSLVAGDTVFFTGAGTTASGILSGKPTQAGSVWTVSFTNTYNWAAFTNGVTLAIVFARLPAGQQGPQGPQGVPGEKWFSGTGAPGGATGIVGDWYLNDANGDVYEKTATSTWTLRDNLTGPTGSQGPAGSTGGTGSQGPAGPGVPAGGLAYQVLNKVDAADFNTAWTDPLARSVSGLLSSHGSGAWPSGVSMMSVTLAEAQADGGWPIAASATVMSVKPPGSTLMNQWWMQSNITSQAMYFRSVASASAGPWVALNPARDMSPVGTIIMYGANPASGSWPAGYERCDGHALSRPIASGGSADTYAALFAVIGTNYGAGDGTTTFNVPNFGSGVPARVPQWGTPGLTGGAATHGHTFTSGHNHSVPAHSHPLGSNGWAAVSFNAGNPFYRLRRVTSDAWTSNIMSSGAPTGTVATSDSTSVTLGAALLGDTNNSVVVNTGSGNLDGNTDLTSSAAPWLGVIFFIKAFS